MWTAVAGPNVVMPSAATPINPTTATTYTARTILGVGRPFLWWLWRDTPTVTGDDGPASAATAKNPTTATPDATGGYYFTDTSNYRVRHVDAGGVVPTVAGSGTQTGVNCAWDVPALQACLSMPNGVTVDAAGRVVLTDADRLVVLRIDGDGIPRRVAGTGRLCQAPVTRCGEGGPAVAADLGRTTNVRSTPAGLVIAEALTSRVLLVRPDGVLVRLAGNGTNGFGGDEGPATAATLWATAGPRCWRGCRPRSFLRSRATTST